MNKILTNLENRIKKSNPSFTISSFRRTIESVIIEERKLSFMEKISDEEVIDVVLAIPMEWEIEKRIRN